MDGSEFTAEQPVFSTLWIWGDKVTAMEKGLRQTHMPVLTPVLCRLAGQPPQQGTFPHHATEVSPLCLPEGWQEQARWNYYSF